jgi:hypothetical protein
MNSDSSPRGDRRRYGGGRGGRRTETSKWARNLARPIVASSALPMTSVFPYRRELDTRALRTAPQAAYRRIRELENAGKQDSPLYLSLVRERTTAQCDGGPSDRASNSRSSGDGGGPDKANADARWHNRSLPRGGSRARPRSPQRDPRHSSALAATYRRAARPLLGRLPEPPRRCLECTLP